MHDFRLRGGVDCKVSDGKYSWASLVHILAFLEIILRDIQYPAYHIFLDLLYLTPIRETWTRSRPCPGKTVNEILVWFVQLSGYVILFFSVSARI